MVGRESILHAVHGSNIILPIEIVIMCIISRHTGLVPLNSKRIANQRIFHFDLPQLLDRDHPVFA